MAKLKADGVTIVYISHKLDEVERITDEVIVMRDGRFVARNDNGGACAAADGEPDGRPRTCPTCSPTRSPCPRARAVALKVGRAHGAGWVDDLSFDVRAGESARLRRPRRRGPHRSRSKRSSVCASAPRGASKSPAVPSI